MEKYEFTKCMSLHKILKDQIKGGIFIAINNGQLTININGHRGIKYRRIINDLPYKINVEKMAEEILYDYRKFIKNKFFYEIGGII